MPGLELNWEEMEGGDGGKGGGAGGGDKYGYSLGGGQTTSNRHFTSKGWVTSSLVLTELEQHRTSPPSLSPSLAPSPSSSSSSASSEHTSDHTGDPSDRSARSAPVAAVRRHRRPHGNQDKPVDMDGDSFLSVGNNLHWAHLWTQR